MKHGLIIISFIFSTLGLSAQSTPKYSNDFLNIGVGARAFGMANSTVASCNDVTSGYWNPAGLVSLKDNLQLSFMHSAYLAGIANYDYGALATKLDDKRAIGLSIIRFSVDNIPNTLDLIRNGQVDYNRVSTFSASDYAFLLSYAQKTIREGLTFGGNAKIIYRKAGEFSTAWGFGIDAALQYKSKNEWQFGIMARDITSTFNSWKYSFTEAEKSTFTQTQNEIPTNSLEITLPTFILGAGKVFEINNFIGLNAETNFAVNTDGQRNVLVSSKYFNIDPSLGLEADYKKSIFLRAGIGKFQRELDINNQKVLKFQPNIGIGLKLGSLMLDYSFTDIGDVSAALYSNMFSVRFSINKKSDSK
jgi:hypothetical protein